MNGIKLTGQLINKHKFTTILTCYNLIHSILDSITFTDCFMIVSVNEIRVMAIKNVIIREHILLICKCIHYIHFETIHMWIQQKHCYHEYQSRCVINVFVTDELNTLCTQSVVRFIRKLWWVDAVNFRISDCKSTCQHSLSHTRIEMEAQLGIMSATSSLSIFKLFICGLTNASRRFHIFLMFTQKVVSDWYKEFICFFICFMRFFCS